jgi:cytochrome c553
MKRLLIGAAIVVGVIMLAGVGYIVYVMARYPDAGPTPQVTIAATPARLARGEYLAKHVAVCIDCHSTRDWTKFSGPLVRGTEGKGGFRFGEEMGLPGEVFAQNITPAALGSLSDGELLHAVACGVGKNGRALFPIMPYKSFAELSQEDIFSVLAYIRTLKPIQNDVPTGRLNFPLNIIVRMIPGPYVAHSMPDTTKSLEYGKYLVTTAACGDCHSQQKKGERIKGLEFGGGMEFRFPDGTVRSANITPDEKTGIGSWTKDLFLAKFKAYEHPDSALLSLKEVGYNTPMAWTMYAGMSERDLGMVYDYLRSLPPVKNDVERFTPINQAPQETRK